MTRVSQASAMTLTVYRRCVIPTGLAHQLGIPQPTVWHTRIPYDDLPILDHALLRVTRIVDWSDRLGAALHRTAVLGPACRLAKIEAAPVSATRTGTQDFGPDSLPQPLHNLVRPIAVFCLGSAAQGAEWH